MACFHTDFTTNLSLSPEFIYTFSLAESEFPLSKLCSLSLLNELMFIHKFVQALQRIIATALYKSDAWRYKHIFVTFVYVLSDVPNLANVADALTHGCFPSIHEFTVYIFC